MRRKKEFVDEHGPADFPQSAGKQAKTVEQQQLLSDKIRLDTVDVSSKPPTSVISTTNKLHQIDFPFCDYYCKSYMHCSTCSHVKVATANDFVLTASDDGHIKFWSVSSLDKSGGGDLEFVKDFRAHMGPISCISLSRDHKTMASVCCRDGSLKMFDVLSFDMICMIRLAFRPGQVAFVGSRGDRLLICDAESPTMHVFDSTSSKDVHQNNRLHSSHVFAVCIHPVNGNFVTIDHKGYIEYSRLNPNTDEIQAVREPDVSFESKLDTDMFAFVDGSRYKSRPISTTFSPVNPVDRSDPRYLAIVLADSGLVVFDAISFRIVYEWNNEQLSDSTDKLSRIERSRRRAVEEELKKQNELPTTSNHCLSVCFDSSGSIIFYPTMMGVFLISMDTRTVVAQFGLHESIRFTNVVFWEETPKSLKLNSSVSKDKKIFLTGFKKERFFIFTTALNPDYDRRDACNERPSNAVSNAGAPGTNDAEGVEAGNDDANVLNSEKLAETATIHTSLGDIYVQLYPIECPRTIENFCGLTNQGYYNGNIFHRVIRQFMIQTGDPEGTGAGGKSLWGGEFEDEIHPSLKHDRPYTLSMANYGPNTNGSQFFITVVSCPWLDGKHTVFGRVTKGTDIVHKINNLKIDHHDTPLEEVKIINISLK